MKHKAALLLLLFVSVHFSGCASFRVVPLAQGANEQGEVKQFYAVAQNNMVIPEYTINERNEYPDTREEAWQRFRSRKSSLLPQMKEKYKIPGNVSSSFYRTALTSAFTLMLPISYPLYALSAKRGERSLGDYYDLMVYGPYPVMPKLRDEFSNF